MEPLVKYFNFSPTLESKSTLLSGHNLNYIKFNDPNSSN